jgi:hypothetical protein
MRDRGRGQIKRTRHPVLFVFPAHSSDWAVTTNVLEVRPACDPDVEVTTSHRDYAVREFGSFLPLGGKCHSSYRTWYVLKSCFRAAPEHPKNTPAWGNSAEKTLGRWAKEQTRNGTVGVSSTTGPSGNPGVNGDERPTRIVTYQPSRCQTLSLTFSSRKTESPSGPRGKNQKSVYSRNPRESSLETRKKTKNEKSMRTDMKPRRRAPACGDLV